MNLILEVFFTTIRDRKVFYSKHLKNIISESSDPDNLVLDFISKEINKSPRIINENFIIHSTSWRYEKSGEIVITYIAFADEIDFKNLNTKSFSVTELEIVRSTNPKKPRPENISEKNVLSHALRHLGFLIRTKGGNTYTKIINEENKNILEKIYINLSGEI